MIRMKQVMAIARAETRITRRLARYWIFLSLAFLIALILYSYYSAIHGFLSSYSATVALVGPRYLITAIGGIYSLVFIVGAIFLAFDIRARDMRERMNEVLDSRPYTNLELVVGRFLGILIPSWVPILILAILLELLGLLLISLGSPVGEPIETSSLFGYVFLAALPALAFTLSVVFLVTLLVRNRLVAAVVLLALLGGYIWSMTYLHMANRVLFDFVGNGDVIFPSEIIPAAITMKGLFQRLTVLLATFGILGLCAAVHPRLDGGSRSKLGICGAGLISLALVIIGFGFYKNTGDIKIAETWKQAHAARADAPVPDLQSIKGEVKIIPGKALHLDLDLDLVFRAPGQTPLKNALFTLNPGQEVKEALDAFGQPMAFTHENGLLELALPYSLNPGDETKIHLSIEGLPDLRFAFLESAIDPATVKDLQGTIYILGFEPAIFDPRFVALMPSIRWLPDSGPEKGRDDPRTRAVDFFEVDLFVDLPKGWLVAGPGRRHEVQGGTDVARFHFAPPAPVPEVALIASRFESRSVEIEGVLLELLIHHKHMRNLEVMAEAGEKMRAWIEERLQETKESGLSYPYDGLTLVEVPASLRGYVGGWRMDTAMAPPGMFLMREMTFPTARFDAAFRKPEAFKDREGGLAQAKWDRLRNYFMNDFSGGNIFTGAARNFFVYQTAAQGQEALALNFVMETLSTLLVTETKGYFSIHLFENSAQVNQFATSLIFRSITGQSQGTSIADAAIDSMTSRPEVWDQALGVALTDTDPWEDPARTVDVLTLKANAVALSILDILGPEKTGQLLSSLRDAHKGESFTLNDMLEAGKTLGYDLEELLGDWLGSTTLPGFVCADAEAYRLPDSADGSPRYQLLFSVRNDEPAPGLFRFVFLFAGEGGGSNTLTISLNSGINVTSNWDNVKSQPIRLAGRSAVRFGTVMSRPPTSVLLSPYLSLNRASFPIQLPPIDQGKIGKAEAFEGFEQIPWNLPEEPFIVVDDLDPGFKIVEDEHAKGFRINAREDKSEVTDQGLPVAPPFERPQTWSRKVDQGSWGKYRHTTALVRAGKGSKKAMLTATIPNTGSWELEIHMPPKESAFTVRKWGVWNLVIEDGNGDPHEIRFDSKAATGGWNLAGNFDLPEGETSVIFSDKTDGQVVMADAIRWSPSVGE
jgi:ABC-type transport system involved in multi-copper enzyme maturation permease subunit